MTRARSDGACALPASGASLRMMRRVAVPFVSAVLGLSAPGLSAPARAQVTVDLHALEALPKEAGRPVPPPAPRPAARRVTPRRVVRPLIAETHAPIPQASAGKPNASAPVVAPPAAPLPSIAAAAPPAATVTPLPTAPPPVQTAAPPIAAPPIAVSGPPPSPPPVPAPARTLRVGFAPGQSDLSASEADAIAGLARDVRRTDATSFEVLAHAPAVGGDASAARRLSLARALAVRSALAAAGVPTASILVRALGAPPATEAGAADRAVVTVMGANGPETAPEQGKP